MIENVDRPRQAFGLAMVLFCLASFYLSWPWLSGQVTIPWDAKAHFQPQLSFLAHQLHAGRSPFWNPHIFAGMPQIADPQSLIFSPPYLLLALLEPQPSFQQADGVAYLMLTLGGLGWMLFFRDRGWSAAGALITALAFAYGGSAAWRIQHTGQILSLSWFPLALWALARALERGSALWGLVAGALAGLMVLGRDQVAWLFVLTLTAYVVVFAFSGPGFRVRAPRMIAPLGAGLVSGLLLAGPALIMTIALAHQSNRAEITLEGALHGSLHPAALLTAVSANLYGVHGSLSGFWGPPSSDWGETGLYIARNMGEIYYGALPFVALLLLLAAPIMRRDWTIRFFMSASLFALVYALGKYTPVFPALFDVPGANLFRRPADATFALCAFAACLGGYAFHCATLIPLRERRGATFLGFVLIGLALVTAYALGVSKGHAQDAARALAFSTLFLVPAVALVVGASLLSARPYVSVVLVAVLLTMDLSLNNAPNDSTGLPPATYDVLRENTQNETIRFLKDRLAISASEKDRRDRVEMVGVGFDWPNASMTHGFDHDLGYNPLRLINFYEATHAPDHVALSDYRVFSPAFPSYRSVMANLLGLRYIAAGTPIEQIDKGLRSGSLPLIAQTRDAYIYENLDALPRVLAPGGALAVDFKQLERQGNWPKLDYRQTVLLDDATCRAQAALHCAHDEGTGHATQAGSARLIRYEPTRVEVEVVFQDAGGFLVLNDVWHPWWRARIDDVPIEILQANLIFRAVPVSAGRHRVVFYFDFLKAFQ